MLSREKILQTLREHSAHKRDLKGLLEKELLRESGSAPTDPNRGYEPGGNLFPKEL